MRWALTAIVAMLVSVVVFPGLSDDRAAVRGVLAEVSARADEGDPESLYRMYTVYNKGFDSIQADSLKALRMLRLAAEGGYREAQNLLGYKLYRGDGVEQDVEEGLAWLEQAAIAGHHKAAGNLGYLLLYGDGVVHDDENAAYWLQRAADGDVATAQSMLADLYLEGRGVEQDSLMADSLYRRALDLGLTDAAFHLYTMHEHEWSEEAPALLVSEGLNFYHKGVPGLGVLLFENAAGRGDAHAMALLGDAYTRGMGVEYNHQKALDYYAQAAAAGYAPAMFIIAELLEILPDSLDTLSPGVKALYETLPHDAASWFERAATAGVSDAATANRLLISN